MSSAPSGSYWVNADFPSAARMNRKNITVIPGSEVNSLSPTFVGQIVVVSETGGGFAANDVVVRNDTNTAWRGITGGIHRHSAETDQEGGSYDNMLRNNQRTIYVSEQCPVTGSFANLVTGGTVVNEVISARVSLRTGTSEGNKVHSSRPGLQINYGERTLFQWKGYVTHGTFVSTKVGINMEDVSEDHDTDRKFGIEACDSAGIARTWELVAASGAIRDTVATSEAVAQTAPRRFHVRSIPGQNVRCFGSDGEILATNSNNVAASGLGSGRRNIGIGVKTNNNVEKIMYIHALSMIAVSGDPLWVNLVV